MKYLVIPFREEEVDQWSPESGFAYKDANSIKYKIKDNYFLVAWDEPAMDAIMNHLVDEEERKPLGEMTMTEAFELLRSQARDKVSIAEGFVADIDLDAAIIVAEEMSQEPFLPTNAVPPEGEEEGS
ncbi:MAG: hypothetical protein KAJ19_25595 [Gammaproteobacteria bacterium]|nr:hypothetical protein [Gammaproteobacteria bacterium]